MSKPVYFKIKMWICCITVHIVIDQIFDNGLSFSFLCEYYSRVRSVEKLNIILTTVEKCMKIWFCLKPLSCGFCIGGKCLNITLFDSEKLDFFLLVVGLSLGSYRRMLPNVFPSDVEAIWWSILSLCLYALISLLRVRACLCVCLWACGLVITSQFNLLKIYVHPALPAPAPPQALNFSTAVCLISISHVSVLSSSKRGQAIS